MNKWILQQAVYVHLIYFYIYLYNDVSTVKVKLVTEGYDAAMMPMISPLYVNTWS